MVLWPFPSLTHRTHTHALFLGITSIKNTKMGIICEQTSKRTSANETRVEKSRKINITKKRLKDNNRKTKKHHRHQTQRPKNIFWCCKIGTNKNKYEALNYVLRICNHLCGEAFILIDMIGFCVYFSLPSAATPVHSYLVHGV